MKTLKIWAFGYIEKWIHLKPWVHGNVKYLGLWIHGDNGPINELTNWALRYIEKWVYGYIGDPRL
jgi:hypothetical protein